MNFVETSNSRINLASTKADRIADRFTQFDVEFETEARSAYRVCQQFDVEKQRVKVRQSAHPILSARVRCRVSVEVRRCHVCQFGVESDRLVRRSAVSAIQFDVEFEA